MSENMRESYKSNPVIVILEFMVVGFFSGFFLRLPYRIIWRFIPGFYILKSNEILICHIIGIIIAVIFILMRYTTICIEGKSLTVKQRFRKQTFSLEKFTFRQEGKIIKSSYFSSELRWLVIEAKGYSKTRIRLYSFTVGKCDELNNSIIANESHSLPDYLKSYINQKSWEGEKICCLDGKSIIKNEWKSVRQNSVIWIVLTIAVAAILHFSYTDSDWEFMKISALILILVMCVINIPFDILRARINSGRCVTEISFKGDHLMINEDHFMISEIEILKVTHSKTKSSSLYPVQRYITIKSFGEIHKYWVGSEYSIALADYERVTEILRIAFINYPERIKYISKRSIWNK